MPGPRTDGGLGLVRTLGDSHLSHHRLSRRLLVALLLVFGTSTAAMGQITKSIREAVDAKPDRPLIDAFIANEIKGLSSEDPKLQKGARDSLAQEANAPNVSASFLDEYADSLNAAVLPLAKADVHVRLCAAVCVARVAAKAGNNRLSGAALMFIKDKNAAVALWGLKAAKYILPTMILGLQNPAPMGQAVMEAAKEHATGAVVEEAYNTLLLQPDTNSLRTFQPPVLKPYVAIPIAFFDYRVKLYEDLVPPQPMADTLACKFLVNSNVWQALTGPQQRQTLQLMLDLVKNASKQNATAAMPELIDVIRQTGGAFEVAAGPLKCDPLKKAGHSLSSVNNDISSTDLDSKIDDVDKAIQTLP